MASNNSGNNYSNAQLILLYAQSIADGNMPWNKVPTEMQQFLATFANQGVGTAQHPGAAIGTGSTNQQAQAALKLWVGTSNYADYVAAAKQGNTSAMDNTQNGQGNSLGSTNLGGGGNNSLLKQLQAAASGAGAGSSTTTKTKQDYLDAAARAGIPVGQLGNVSGLVDKAVQGQWDSARFDLALRRTDTYQKYAQTAPQDYLNAALSAGIPANQLSDFQALAQKASNQGWDMAKFEEELKTSPEYQKIVQASSIASYQAVLQGAQLPDKGNIGQLVQHAAANGWTTDQFTQALYQTPEFHKAFPGIFNPNGTLKMDPSTYIAQAKQYQAYASINGVNVNQKDIAYAFRNNISPDVFNQRTQAEGQLIQNDALMKQFSAEAVRAGLPKPTHQDLYKMLLGEGNVQYTTLWNQAASAYGAHQAGLQLGKNATGDLSINRKMTEKIAQQGLTPDQLSAKYSTMAQDLLKYMPLSRMSSFGLTKREVEAAAFGGKGSVQAQQKIQQLESNLQADLNNRTTQSSSSLGLGTRGAPGQGGF